MEAVKVVAEARAEAVKVVAGTGVARVAAAKGAVEAVGRESSALRRRQRQGRVLFQSALRRRRRQGRVLFRCATRPLTLSSSGLSIAPVGLAGDERMSPLIGGTPAAVRASCAAASSLAVTLSAPMRGREA